MTKTQQANEKAKTLIGSTVMVNGRSHRVNAVGTGRWSVSLTDLDRNEDCVMRADDVLFCGGAL